MHNEELNEKEAKMVNEYSEKVLVQINELLKTNATDRYTKYNMIMNVLTCCMVKMMVMLPDELRGTFIGLINTNLKINLKMIREKER